MALLETLTDDFEAGTLDPKWTDAGTGGTAAPSFGTLACRTGGNFTGGVRSTDSYTLGASSHLIAKTVIAASTTYKTKMMVSNQPDGALASGGTSFFQITGGFLYCYAYDQNGFGGAVGSGVAYSATTHAWLRLRLEAVGTTVNSYYDTSPDGVVWTNRTGTTNTWASATGYARLVVEGNGDATSRLTTFDDVNLPPPPPPLLETLVDDFPGVALDPQWTPTVTGGSTVTVAGGFLTLATSASSTTALAQIQPAVSPYGIVGSSISMRVAPQSQASGAVTALRVENTAGNGYAWIRYTGGTSMSVQAFNTANSLIGGGSRTYNAFTWAYWRIRVDATGTALYFECSSDGVTWTIDTTCNNPGWGTSVRVLIYCQNSTAIAAVTRIDSINTPPTAFADTVADDFLTPILDPAKWTTAVSGGGTVTTTGDGWATLATSATDPTSSAAITTVRSDLMLNGSWAMATTVEPSPVAGVGTYLHVSDGAGNTLTMGRLGANLVWFLNANAPTTIAAYNATSHRHWRIIATSAGVATPQYSADGITWGSSANSTIAWGAAVSARIYVQNNNTAATGVSRVDAINMFGARTPVDQVTEDFPGSALDPTKWQDVTTGGGTVGVDAGLLNLTVATTAINDGPEIKATGQPLTLIGSSIYARVLPSLAANTETALVVANSGGAFGYAAIRFVGTMVFRTMYNTANSATLNQVTTNYIPAEWAYVRIRLDATGINIYFDRSPDAVTWTQVSNAAGPGWGSSVEVRLRLKNTATAVGTRTAAFDTINLLAPAPPTLPTSLADTETLGAPAAAVALSAAPDGTADTETLGTPALAVAVAVQPDPIAETETLGAPDAAFIPTTSTPDGITDTETLDGPQVALAPELAPDGIAEVETLGEPDLPLVITGAPDSLTDTETLDDPHLGFQATEIDADGITDAETFGTAQLGFYPSEINPAGIVDPLTVGAPSSTFVPHYNGAYNTGSYGIGPYSGIAFEPYGIVDLDVVGRPDLFDSTTVPPNTIIVAELVDTETLGQPDGSLPDPTNLLYGMGVYGEGVYFGAGPTPPTGTTVPNINYGYGTYGYGIYYGSAAWEPTEPLFPEATKVGAPLHILGIGPWSPTIDWRGAPNYHLNRGPRPARPAMALPPATGKGFTLRLGDGGEARCELAFPRGSAIIIDEMDTDLWWRRRDPRTGTLEMIGRFNTAHVGLSTTDTGVNCSVQFVDYYTLLSERMVLKYLHPNALPSPESQWKIGTPITDILAWALPSNTGLDLSAVTGPDPYNLGKTTGVFHLPADTNIADLMDNLNAMSPAHWEWWIETPLDVHLAPKLQFKIGGRGTDRGVTLVDLGSGPTPIAEWTRNAASDEYANSLYYTGGSPPEGVKAYGGVVLNFPAQVEQYGQRDALYGNSSVNGGDKEVLRQRANKKLESLADRRASYNIRLAQSFWRGRHHIDIGDTVRLRLRLGVDALNEQFRVSELTVDIDENGLEEVSLTLGRLTTSADPRSKRSPIARVMRYLKNYEVPKGAADIPTDD